MFSRTSLFLAALAAFLAATPPAAASELVTRNPRDVGLKIDAAGRAVVYYTQNGQRKHPLFWGATNARPSSPDARQIAFKVDYSGGWGAFRKPIWKTIKNACKPYDGPALPWLVTVCKAPDGSYWALQRWQKMLPNLGIDPWKPEQSAWELHLSHWSGELPQLEVWLDWAYSRKFHHLIGRFTYRGLPVYGFGSTSVGNPTDDFGRNIYLDTYNSVYGPGWRRENSFLTHQPNGNFCYLFSQRSPYSWYPQVGPRGPANGERYRLTVMGPGVTPIVTWEGAGLADYNASNPEHVAHEQQMNALVEQLAAGDTSRTPCDQR